MRCANCKHKTNRSEKYCPNCGSEIKKHKKSSKRMPVIIACICCLALIFSGLFGGIMLFSNKTDNVAALDGNYNCFLEGFTDVIITDEETAIDAVASVAASLGIVDAEKELKVAEVSLVGQDKYYRLQQFYCGIPVYGKTIVVSADAAGYATALTSNFVIIKGNLDLQPTITFDDLKKSVLPYLGATNLEVTNFNDDGLILYELEPNEFILAYNLIANGENLIVDANSAEVLFSSQIYSDISATVTSKENKITATGWKNDDGSYHLYNDEYKISVFDVNGVNTVINENGSINPDFTDYQRKGKKLDTLYSNNEIFDFEAVTLLNQTIKISDFFKKLGYEGFDRLHVAINDSYQNGTNARGGGWIINEVKSGSILMGSQFNYDTIDVIAHEYTHAVTGILVGWSGTHMQNSALNEAYSDVFGVLYENAIEPDWKLVHLSTTRDFIDPKQNGNYSCVSEINSKDNYNQYTLSTIISHSAYLMWNGIDGKDEKAKIDSDKLAKLWYRSLYLMQSDATFSQCRNAVELSARIMVKNKELTDKQYQCIVEAFEQTGIVRASYTSEKTVKNAFTLSVLSHQETENVSFNLTIYKREKYSFDLFGLKLPYTGLDKVYEKNHIKGNVELDLEDGRYEFYIKDNSDVDSETIKIKVVVDNNLSTSTDNITIYTDFTDITTIILNESPIETTPETTEPEKPNNNESSSVAFAGGKGTQKEPYKVSTPAQLNAVRNDLSAHYIQINDIDMSSYDNWQPIGNVIPTYEMGGYINTKGDSLYFTGTYNGNNYKITNLKIYDDSFSPKTDCFGLFAGTEYAEISNVNLTDIKYEITKDADKYLEEDGTYSLCVGGLVGRTSDKTILNNCSVSGSITVQGHYYDYIGGIVGYGNASNCTNYADINVSTDGGKPGDLYCGGISGQPNYREDEFLHCKNYGNIQAVGKDFVFCGGITGQHGTIKHCENHGDIVGKNLYASWMTSFGGNCNVGGISGATFISIENSINYGNVSSFCNNPRGVNGCGYAGGIVGFIGYNGNGILSNNYNYCEKIVSEDLHGGRPKKGGAGRIAGGNENVISDCYSIDTTTVDGSVPSLYTTAYEINGQTLTKEEIDKLIKNIE